MKINIKEINNDEREIRMVKKKDLQRLQVAGSERVSRGKRRRKRVEKSSGKGECNA